MATSSPGLGGRGTAGEHNVPTALTPLVGRARELAGVGEALRKTRLVTLTGTGGVGKTRLALDLARRQIAHRSHGVWLVDLSAAPAHRDPAAEVARTLDVGARSESTPTESLCRYLADRDVLLVVDNCEHVIGACAALAAALLSACDDVHILATSREPLGVNGETVWRLEPLEPQEAHRLFLQRARQRRPQFIANEESDAAIARLCTRLDHLPLAIELAAARIAMMSPAEILAGLEARLGELGGGSRLSAPRHRTMRATVEWSHDLLDLDEQRAFRSLGVFVGGFDAAAATAVAPGLTMDVFARLVDKSMVTVGESPHARTRYRLLATMREYAHDLLVAAEELDGAHERQLRHFSALCGDPREGWPSAHAVRILDELEDDYGNVRAAVEWAATSDPCAGVRLFAATRDLFIALGQADGRRLAQLLLEGCPTRDRHRAVTQITAGLLAMLVGDGQAARSAHTSARDLAAELDERPLEGWALFLLGLSEMLGGAIEDARVHLRESRAIHQQSGVPTGAGLATASLGLTFAIAHELARAQELLEEALAIAIAEGYRWGQGHAHIYLGITASAAGSDPQRVTAHYREAVDCLRPYRDASLLPTALVGQADVLRHREPARALRVAAAASDMRARIGGEFPPYFRERAERVRTACEAALGADADRIRSDGARLGVDDAIALAFGTSRPRPTAPAGMSARELEVVGLVADGRSNKAIAADLHLSVRTVESHVRHVLAKLGLDNRTQLAAWAHERSR